ncbi:MAG: hypothetical protein M1497_03265 [Nitrospirae bacterium]|nr:hypothetical protein [Nitrospirota bacterium]
MIPSFLVSILMPPLLGFLVVSFLWPRRKAGRDHSLLRLSIGAGTGFGLSALAYFLWLLAVGPESGFILLEGVLLTALAVLFLAGKARRASIAGGTTADLTPKAQGCGAFARSKLDRYLLLIFCGVCISALSAFLLLSARQPHGAWDAWAIWNLRARFIFRSGAQWRGAFTPLLDWSHPDYPLLLPLSVVQGWRTLGAEIPALPAAVGFLYTFSTLFLTCSSLSVLRSRTQGLLAGLVLLGTPFFVQHGASQYADVPLGFFYLSTVVLLALYDGTTGEGRGLLFLAGMMAGCSAWTKNEGILFVAAVIAGRALAVIPFQGWRSYAGEMIVFLLGAMPELLVVGYFKMSLAPPNDVLSAQGLQGVLGRLGDPSRYLYILKSSFLTAFTFTKGIVTLPVLALYFFLLGRHRRRGDGPRVSTGVTALALTATGYALFYVITPHDLAFHLDYSLNRLFLQLWPSFLFCFFLSVRTPEESVASPNVPRSGIMFP